MNLAIFSKPSRYINHEINSISPQRNPAGIAEIRMALAFPDVYEIGMSHLGLKILYTIINTMPFARAERVFAPWIDMESYLRGNDLHLSSLESGTPLRDFDIVGFSLQYELSYTAVLNMLDLGGIPVRRENRDNAHPLIIAGGPCTVNPAPLSGHIDAFLIGDAEETIKEFLNVYRESGKKRDHLLKEIAKIEGVFAPAYPKEKTRRIFIDDLNTSPYPTAPAVPYCKLVHDRVNIEVSRGCSRGCRFCQAGSIYRPVRERHPEKVLSLAEETIRNTGYDEVSFTSLSAGDYSQLIPLLQEFNRRFRGKKVSVSLPSLRVGAVNNELLAEVKSVRKSGFTIAPEAASDRLRSVINKDFSEDDYERALRSLFGAGWQTIKLYFMIGLPTETWDDIKAIVAMAKKSLKIAREFTSRRVNIKVGLSPFIPKPHTPFQWLGQEETARLAEKKRFILHALSRRNFTVKSHNEQMSLLEAAISRGDSSIGKLLECAWKYGSRLDAWSECFDYEIWEKAMTDCGIDASEYALGQRDTDDILPWDNIDVGLKKGHLVRELDKSIGPKMTPGCSDLCHSCGLECSSGQFMSREPFISRSAKMNTIHKKINPVRVRAEFSKTGELRYLSHLELMTTLLRALRRAEVPLKYSEGFRPSPRVSFGPALGVGIAGESEFFDMEVFPPFDTERYMKIINGSLPAGISIKKMIFIDRSLPSLNRFIDCYEYLFEFSDNASVTKFSERTSRGRDVYAVTIDSAIINRSSVRITIREPQGESVRLTELTEKLFGVSSEKVNIRRTGMWRWLDRLLSPMEADTILEKEMLSKQNNKKSSARSARS